MSKFLVEALDPVTKQIGTIEVRAESEQEARTKVERGGYRVIEMRYAPGDQGAAAAPAAPAAPAPQPPPPPERPRPSRPAEPDTADVDAMWASRREPRSAADNSPRTSRTGSSSGGSGGGAGGGALAISLIALLLALGALGTVLYFNFVKKSGGGWRNYDWSTPAAAVESTILIGKRADVLAALEAAANGVLNPNGVLDKMFRPAEPERFAQQRKLTDSMRLVEVVKDGDAKAYAIIEAKDNKAEREVFLLRKLEGESLWQVGDSVSLATITDADLREKVRKIKDAAN